LTGTQFVPRARVLEVFAADRNHSVLRIPLDQRRHQLETIPWVEHATVRRALPNRVEVEILERTPIAFLRQGSELSLVDFHGVILERPTKAAFHFPVVTGISAEMAQEDRERRMRLYAAFAQQIEAARGGALEKVSEVDLADVNDLRASLTGLAGRPAGTNAAANASSGAFGQADAPLLVHFGDGDFETKYRNLVENIGHWRATAGRVDSVDLRFNREAVVNPDTTVVAQPKQKVTPAHSAPPKSSAASVRPVTQKATATQKSSAPQKTNVAQKSSTTQKSSAAKRSASGQKPGAAKKPAQTHKSTPAKTGANTSTPNVAKHVG
jgi:cell division protein FtsQ